LKIHPSLFYIILGRLLTLKTSSSIWIKILSLILLFNSQALMAEQRAELDCLVKPEMYVELSSAIDAIIDQMLVDTGDYIVKGQPLVRLESSVERARVRLAKIQAASKTEIKSREIQLLYAQRNKKRINELYDKHSVSQFENDKSETEVALAEIELIKAKENRQLANLNLNVAQSQLALRTILSPINGLVVERYAMVGESVSERTIMKLAQIDPLRIELIAPTEYFGLIKKGMDVEIYTERPANQVFKAKVTVVDQLIDPASGSFTVRMAVPNPDDQLVSGVNCLASFNFAAPLPSDQNLIGSSDDIIGAVN
jgi:RND family efflux transporter MFP subunit